MFVGIGIGINRTRFAGGFADSYSSRVIANGGIIEALTCVDAASSLLRSASLLLIPSGFKAGVAYAQLPANANGDLTWSRASSATRTLASGTIETPRTNHIRNSSMVGASTSPSTLPTNWVSQSTAGLTLQVASVGTEDGLNYVDVRYSGTATSTTIRLFLEAGNQIVAADGQTWTSSFYTSISGSALPSNYRLGVATNTAAGFSVSSIVATPNIPQTTTLTRYNRVVILPGGATVARAQPGIYLTLVSGQTYDFTIRIAAPQFELGLQVTDWIPTTNSARTTFAGITQDGLSASNIARLSYLYGSCPALLLEPQRTNSIRNSSMVGAVAGSPGTLPTNWVNGQLAGLSRQIVGVGTENGLPYIDFRFFGTTNTADGIRIDLEGGTIIAAATGQTWAYSLYSKLISGTPPTTSFTFFERNSGGGSITSGNVAFAPTSTLTRFSATRTLSGGATVAFVQPSLNIATLNSTAYDFTIRIAAPQLELGAFATTWIDTTNAAATRLADTFSRNNIYTNGLISASGGTWYLELRNNVSYVRDVNVIGLFISDTNTGTTNSLAIRGTTGSRLTISKSVSGTVTTIYTTTSDTVKLALKWNGTSADIFQNGVKVVSATAFTTTLMEFLAHSTSGEVPKFIQAMALFNTPLSDTDCTTLTT